MSTWAQWVRDVQPPRVKIVSGPYEALHCARSAILRPPHPPGMLRVTVQLESGDVHIVEVLPEEIEEVR